MALSSRAIKTDRVDRFKFPSTATRASGRPLSRKEAIRPANRLKFKTNVTYKLADAAIYNHRDVNNISYDFNLDGLPVQDRESYLVGTSGNYAFSDRVFMSMTFNQFYSEVKTVPAHLKVVYWIDWPGFSVDANGVYNGNIHIDNYCGNPDF